ncbi:hypothetical protein HK102_012879, partial [Quaeritorhiza haematococci]
CWVRCRSHLAMSQELQVFLSKAVTSKQSTKPAMVRSSLTLHFSTSGLTNPKQPLTTSGLTKGTNSTTRRLVPLPLPPLVRMNRTMTVWNC